MSVYQKLLNIQTELKAPKSQYNSYGKYNYRNCEDILEAVKPLLKKENCTLFLTDEVETIENRFYIRVTVHFVDIDDGTTINVTAFAREEESKKGMDGSQVTGASSSYARKYALNGLFCIDDTKDSDATNKEEDKPDEAKKEEKKEKKRLANAIKSIDELAKKLIEIKKVEKNVVTNVVKENFQKKGKGVANYNAIKDLETATKVYKALQTLDKESEEK